MKKSVVFIIIMLLVFPSILAFSWDSFINGITGRASTSNTNVSIQVLVPVPNLTIVHPTNTTYSDNSSLSLNFTAQYATIIWYHIDSNANVTITGNTTFNVSEGGGEAHFGGTGKPPLRSVDPVGPAPGGTGMGVRGSAALFPAQAQGFLGGIAV